MESTLFRVLGDNMFVVDHGYDRGGKKDHILLVPRDIEKQAYDAACMYAGEDEETRQELFNLTVTLWPNSGHAGLFDADGTYFSIAYISGKHENFDTKSYDKI